MNYSLDFLESTIDKYNNANDDDDDDNNNNNNNDFKKYIQIIVIIFGHSYRIRLKSTM